MRIYFDRNLVDSGKIKQTNIHNSNISFQIQISIVERVLYDNSHYIDDVIYLQPVYPPVGFAFSEVNNHWILPFIFNIYES